MNTVFLGNILDVFANRTANLPRCRHLAQFILCRFIGVKCLQGELSVNGDGRLVIGQIHQTIRAVAVRKRGLKTILVGGQGIGNDAFHAPLAKSPPRLFVR